MTSGVSSGLQQAYDAQYDASMQAWRMLGARKKVQNILRITAGQRYPRVLEVGAGDGSVLAQLAQTPLGIEWHALEISDSGLAQLRARKIPGLAHAAKFDGYDIPYPDQHFDLVILTHVLEHVEDERRLLRALARVARQVLIEVPREYRHGAHHKLNYYLGYGHINLYTPTSLQFLLGTEGYRVQRVLLEVFDLAALTFAARRKKGLIKYMALAKAYASYATKKLLCSLPIPRVQHYFCHTITVLATPGQRPAIL